MADNLDLVFFIVVVAFNSVQIDKLRHSPAIVLHVNVELKRRSPTIDHLAAITEERELAPGNDWKVGFGAVDSGHEKTDVIFSIFTISFRVDLKTPANVWMTLGKKDWTGQEMASVLRQQIEIRDCELVTQFNHLSLADSLAPFH